jgi:hypothetical protein
MNKLSPQDRDLYRAVDEVLHYIWDPIGVSGVPQARDEYDGYLPHVFGLLRSGASEQTIAAYLGEITTDRMGLSANAQHDLEVANVLVDWKDVINERA